MGEVTQLTGTMKVKSEAEKLAEILAVVKASGMDVDEVSADRIFVKFRAPLGSGSLVPDDEKKDKTTDEDILMDPFAGL